MTDDQPPGAPDAPLAPAPARPRPRPRAASVPAPARPRFRSFVVLAEMRTGSNFLEANLNAIAGLRCHGEAFNPAFVGRPNADALLGVTMAERDRDPGTLLRAIAAEPGLNGFRLFGDHDARAFDAAMRDRGCAKVVLTRNPVESYVSHQIARATDQWKLTDVRRARTAVARFDAHAFRAHLDRLQAAQLRVLRALQVSGQTAFWVDYEDIQDLAVIQGLARWLGVEPPGALDRSLKKQNPEPLRDKVENFAEMEAALGPLDRFDLARTPNFEPRRGAAVPRMMGAGPLLFMPVPGGPEGVVRDWLARFGPIADGFNLRSLRDWKAARPGHRSFAVLRHPLARAHAAFCDHVLPAGPGSYPELRGQLRRAFGVAVPEGGLAPGAPWDDASHRRAFEAFLRFLKPNLGGQTAVRVDASWASQAAVVGGFASVNPPDRVLREEGLAEGLASLAAEAGAAAPPFEGDTDPHRARLLAIHDAGLEGLARDACARDCAAWGFGDWRP